MALLLFVLLMRKNGAQKNLRFGATFGLSYYSPNWNNKICAIKSNSFADGLYIWKILPYYVIPLKSYSLSNFAKKLCMNV